jgi:hypothetical protein
MRRGLAALETWLGTRGGRVALLAIAIAVYELESLAAPLAPGRDLTNYLHFYLQLGDSHPPFLLTMLYREPVAPVLLGSALDLGGRPLAEACMAALFAGSILAWSETAAVFGRRARLLTAVGLLVFPGYGILFHEYSSDAVFAAAFAGWAFLVSRAALRPTALRFAAVGAGIGALTLVRPGNESLLLFAVVPLLMGRSWRERAASFVAFLASAGVVLGAWSIYNGVRYDVYAVSRGGNAYLPFFRAFVADHIVSPSNGSASKQLARAVARRLLPLQPYRAYGITLHDFFAHGSARMHEDLIHLSDQVFGWDSNYGKLQAAGFEAIEAHPSEYASGVASTIWDELWYPLFSTAGQGSGVRGTGGGGGAKEATGRVGRSVLPRPSEGEPIPASHYANNTTTPDSQIATVWISPTAHHVVYPSAAEQRRYRQLLRDTERLESPLLGHGPNSTLQHRLNQVSKWYPRLVLLLLVGLAGFLVRRPRHALLVLSLAYAALTVISFTALGNFAVTEFAVPVAPAFVLLAVAGLVGRRSAALP